MLIHAPLKYRFYNNKYSQNVSSKWCYFSSPGIHGSDVTFFDTVHWEWILKKKWTQFCMMSAEQPNGNLFSVIMKISTHFGMCGLCEKNRMHGILPTITILDPVRFNNILWYPSYLLLYYRLYSMSLIFRMIYDDQERKKRAREGEREKKGREISSVQSTAYKCRNIWGVYSSIDRASASVLWCEPNIKFNRLSKLHGSIGTCVVMHIQDWVLKE